MTARIRDVMTSEVVSLSPSMTLKEVDRILVSYGVSGGPVVEDGVLVGVVSRADIVQFLFAEQAEASKVSGFYTSPFPIPLPSLERLDALQSVAAMMADEGIHRVPVLDGAELVGIGTSMDLVRKLGEVGLADG